jgi:hypothetical protein
MNSPSPDRWLPAELAGRDLSLGAADPSLIQGAVELWVHREGAAVAFDREEEASVVHGPAVPRGDLFEYAVPELAPDHVVGAAELDEVPDEVVDNEDRIANMRERHAIPLRGLLPENCAQHIGVELPDRHGQQWTAYRR